MRDHNSEPNEGDIDTRMHILKCLQKIARSVGAKPTAEEVAVYEEYLSEKRITCDEMTMAVKTLLDTWAYRRLPPLPKILTAARPPAESTPSREEPNLDPIALLEREHGVHVAWLCEFRKRDNADGEKRAMQAIMRIEAQVNARMQARGRQPKYTYGAEAFDGSLR